MKLIYTLALFFITCQYTFAQKLLMAWGQKDIENYTKEMYDAAQRLTVAELLSKNLNDKTWAEVFLTMNASVNLYSKDTTYLRGLAAQVQNQNETDLKGTSRLVIWDRIITGDIIFEGKGLVFENDLFKVCGRANQLLQTLTKKKFGIVTINTGEKELKEISERWRNFLSNKPVEEVDPISYKNAQIPEISSLNALHALIISLQDNERKQAIIKKCLKLVYQLDELPTDRGSPASYCDPDTYTFSYLAMLFGEKTYDEKKDAEFWRKFWDSNHDKLVWNGEKGIYQVAN